MADEQKSIELPFYNIEIIKEEDKWSEIPDIEGLCQQACQQALDNRGVNRYCSDLEVSILLTNDKKIRKLNSNFRGKDKPTNVLSFPNIEVHPDKIDELKHHGEEAVLGDIALSFKTIKKEAKEQQKDIKDHVAHLVVHATLHLLGYDHEKDKDAEIMEALEASILNHMGISDPYK